MEKSSRCNCFLNDELINGRSEQQEPRKHADTPNTYIVLRAKNTNNSTGKGIQNLRKGHFKSNEIFLT
ncbi:hypothetical protein COE35_06430 [Priestia megaterium]|nr:hypothetical protein COE35_06430 [Priestia megaterium]